MGCGCELHLCPKSLKIKGTKNPTLVHVEKVFSTFHLAIADAVQKTERINKSRGLYSQRWSKGSRDPRGCYSTNKERLRD